MARPASIALFATLMLTGIGGALVVTNSLGLLYGTLFASFDDDIRLFFGLLDAWRATVFILVGLPLLFFGQMLIGRCLRAIVLSELGLIDTEAWPKAEVILRDLDRRHASTRQLAKVPGLRHPTAGPQAKGLLVA